LDFIRIWLRTISITTLKAKYTRLGMVLNRYSIFRQSVCLPGCHKVMGTANPRDSAHGLHVKYFDADGFYLLKVPYAQPTELVRDILRHGRHVSVLAPDTLRKLVRNEMEAAI
jgi:WYL domain